MQFKKGTSQLSATRKLAYYNVDETSKVYLRLSDVSPPRHQNDHDSNREPQQPRQQPQKKKKSSDDEDDDDDDEDGFAAGGVQYDAPLPKRSIVAVEEEMLPRKGTMEAATSSNHEGGGPDRVDSRDRRVSIDRVGVTRSDRGRERSRDRYRVDRASRDGYTDRVDSRGGGGEEVATATASTAGIGDLASTPWTSREVTEALTGEKTMIAPFGLAGSVAKTESIAYGEGVEETASASTAGIGELASTAWALRSRISPTC